MADESSIREACVQLVARMGYYNDQRMVSEMVDLWSPDGTYGRFGTVTRGREHLAAMFGDHRHSGRTFHLLGVPMFTAVSDEHAASITYATFSYQSESEHDAPWDGIAKASLRYHDSFVKSGDRWLFASRDIEAVLMRDQSAVDARNERPFSADAAAAFALGADS